MKRTFSFFVIISFLCISTLNIANAQLTGTKNIPGDYATLADAINDLNTAGVGAGGVILNLLSSNPQTAPSGGYSITTLTGTSTDQIIIEGNSNTLTAFSPQTTGALNDAIFKIIGSDYVTIRNFIMQENSSNTITAAGTNDMTEWGVALLYASTSDGAQNNMLQGNTISLNRAYSNTFGIYSNVRHSSTNVTTAEDITSASGANSNLQIYGNNISNVNIGISIVGSNTGAYMDTGLDIGGNSSMTGNTITNFGTTKNFSAYVSVNASVNGIFTNNNINLKVSYNSIASSNGGTISGDLQGIFIHADGTLPSTDSITSTVTYNSISLKTAASSAFNTFGINNNFGNSLTSFYINNNDFNNTNVVAQPSGAIIFIFNTGAALNMNFNNNTFTNMTVNNQGQVYFFFNFALLPNGGTKNINNNSIVTQFNSTHSNTLVHLCYDVGTYGTGTTVNNNNNNFSNISLIGSSQHRGWQNTGTGPAVKNFQGNVFENWTGQNALIYAAEFNYGSSVNMINNTFKNFAHNIGLPPQFGYIQLLGGIDTAKIIGNSISSITDNDNGCCDEQVVLRANAVNNILVKNKICDISTRSHQIIGFDFRGKGTISNNYVGNLNVSSTARDKSMIAILFHDASDTVNLYYNTLYLNNPSTNSNFSSTAIDVRSQNKINMRNNIVVNTSNHGPGNITVALTMSIVSNYLSTSNNNLFYAGIPDPSRLIFYSSSSVFDSTLTDFKARVYPADSSSITENPNFISTVGSSTDFLHINSSLWTDIESGGNNIAGITEDYDGNIRQANPGYIGNGSAPDIGADEFELLSNAGVTANVEPEGTLNDCPLKTIAPKATILNPGIVNLTKAFSITYKITGPVNYTSVKYDTLSPGLSRTIIFDSTFTPFNGNYNVKIFTSLPCDVDRSNDTITTSFNVLNYDYGGSTNYFFANSTSCASGAASQPQFCWKDTSGSISLIENGVDVSGGLLTGNIDDGYFKLSGIFGTGKSVKFMGTSYDTVILGTNGIIAFEDFNPATTNNPPSGGIPDASAPTAFFPLWMDISYSNNNVPVNRLSYKITGAQLIVTYDRAPISSGGSADYVSFQIVIDIADQFYTQDSRMLVEYADTTNENTGTNFFAAYNNNTLPTHLVGLQNFSIGNLTYRFRNASTEVIPGTLFGSSPVAVQIGPNANSLNNRCGGGTLTLKVLLEGVQSYIPIFGQARSDTVTVSMRNTSASYEVVDVAKGIIDTSGTGIFSFTKMENGVGYYLVVNHRNSIELWSAAGQSFSGGIMSYDFTTSQSQAFGTDPMAQYGTRFYMFSGDIDQNGIVDGSDGLRVENDAFNFVTGPYEITDLNFDEVVDGSDAIYTDNNASNFVSRQAP